MRRRLWLGVAAATVAACTMAPDADHDEPDAPRAEPLRRPVRTAWVLSSGGPRGFVHVGVLKALDELNLTPDLVVGASVGALVGFLRASGVSANDIETLALNLQLTAMARLVWSADERFSGAPVAMACVAARKRDRTLVAFTAGDAGVAVQASSAIEGQFTPVRIHGEQYIDADWVAPLPVRLARALGAQRVLAIDATAHEDRAPSGAEVYRVSDQRKRALVQADAPRADVVLHPDFGYWVSLSREFRERAITAGYRDTMAQAARLKELHRS